MSAPKGNQFWKARSSHGRKPKWDDAEELREACLEYFQWVEDNPLQKAVVFQGEVKEQCEPVMRPMTIGTLCIFLGITTETWIQYRAREDFSSIVKEADRIIYEHKFAGAASGFLNPNIIARDLGLKDASSHEHTGQGGGPIEYSNLTDDQLDQKLKSLINAVGKSDETAED